jgi:hypothetical protein
MLVICKRQISFCSLLFSVVVFSCAEDDQIIAPFEQALVVEIIGGPTEGATVLNNAHFTFEWRARGGNGSAAFEIQLSGVDAQPISTTENFKSYPGLPEGNYTFRVTAKAGAQNAQAARTFKVGPNLGSPVVVITGPRGSASTGGSGITPVYAPNATAFFQWSGSDVDRFGQIAGFRWRIADHVPFNEFALASVAGFKVPETPGSYIFTLEAKDNAGGISTSQLGYEVKAPAILIIDDKSQSSGVDEVEEDGFFASLFEGFALATWDVAAQGIPSSSDLSGFAVVVIYSGNSSNLWKSVGADFPEKSVALADFVNSGGRLWAMGQGILEDVAEANNHSNPPAASEFEAIYLHLAPATGDSASDAARKWDRAGAASGDAKFSFADDRLGDALNFPRIAIDLQSGDVDRIIAGDGTEVIYGGTDGLGNAIGSVAIRFPAGGTNTQVVFQTFPLFENPRVKSSIIDSRTLALSIMKGIGQ